MADNYDHPQPGETARLEQTQAKLDRLRKKDKASKSLIQAVHRTFNTADGDLILAWLKGVAFAAVDPRDMRDATGLELAHREGQRFIVARIDEMRNQGGRYD
ncbi:MAG: hypothetical protein JKY34_08760 [Kordiimonadaceae bacterium]|nr:hypothetical protein [Kordiimonadaceae bacterium]